MNSNGWFGPHDDVVISSDYIDTNAPIYGTISIVMMIIAIAYFLYPWGLKRRRLKLILVHIPLLIPPLYFAYEALMPYYVNIRIDMLLFIPLFIATGILYLIRLKQLITSRL